MNIFTKIRNLMDCRPHRNPVEFDIGMYCEVAGQSRIYTDVLSCRQYSIPLICAGLNGVYVFITTHIHDRNKLLDIYADTKAFDISAMYDGTRRLVLRTAQFRFGSQIL